MIEDVGPAACLVVIASSMGERLKAHCSAEDIWQETLACAWRSRSQHRWTGVAQFRAWLFEIARNRICDVARSLGAEKRGAGQQAARGLPSAEDTRGVSSDLPPDSVTPSRIAVHAELAAAIQRALEALPSDVRVVVRMHLLEGLTMEEVCERLDIGLSSGWRRFRKGVALYAKGLAEWDRGGSRS